MPVAAPTVAIGAHCLLNCSLGRSVPRKFTPAQVPGTAMATASNLRSSPAVPVLLPAFSQKQIQLFFGLSSMSVHDLAARVSAWKMTTTRSSQ
jgi:hypothetical protein